MCVNHIQKVQNLLTTGTNKNEKHDVTDKGSLTPRFQFER